MANEKNNSFGQNLVTNPTNFIEKFRKNIFELMDTQDLSLRELSEKADMPFETLKSFLYGNTKDCKLSTAVKLASAFNISIDELVGAETMTAMERQNVSMYREMPDYVKYMIASFIKHQYHVHMQFDKKSINIPVALPECMNGYLQTTNIMDTVCIDKLTDGLKARIYMGIKIPCDHYEPFFMPGEIILLGGDRDTRHNERCVVSYNGNFCLARKICYTENEQTRIKYVSLLDGRREILPSDIDDTLGYIVGYLNPDGSWGIR